MSEQPRARAVAGQRAAGGRRSARPGVAPATLNPRIHRRGTHRAEMVDAQPPRRHGRYCRPTAHPEQNRPTLHVPKFLAGAGSTASGHREP